MKRIYIFFITVIVCFQCVFGYEHVVIDGLDFEIDGYVYVSCSSSLERTVIEIPETIQVSDKTYKVNRIKNFHANIYVQKVVIPQNIKVLEDYCFKNCENLKEVIFLGDEISFGRYCFWGTAIETIDLPSYVGGSFDLRNTKIKHLTLPDNLDEDYICTMPELESLKLNSKCKVLRLHNLPKLKTIDYGDSDLAYIGGRNFYGNLDSQVNPWCGMDSLKTLYIPKNAKVQQGFLVWNDNFEGFDVSPENPYYKSCGGALYSHNMDTVYHYPGKENVSIPEGVKAVIDVPYCYVYGVQEEYFWALSSSLKSLTYPSTITTLKLKMQMYEDMNSWDDLNCSWNTLLWDHGGVKNLRFSDPTEHTSVDSIDITMCGYMATKDYGPCVGYYDGDSLYIGRSLGAHDYSYIKELYAQDENNFGPLGPLGPYEFMIYTNYTAFEYEYVEIGEHVKKINAFIYPKKLKTIKLHCSNPPYLRHYNDREKNWKNAPDDSWTGTLRLGYDNFTDFITPVVYVPKGSLEAYRNAPVWREFQNIVEWDESGVEPTDAELLQVAVAGGEITVSGINDNTKVELYNMSGMLVGTAVGPCSLNINSAPGVYILRAGNITRKLRL
ncbi:MAG: leucine-rich repeat domain-containing protein [Muribaculaceae bacterium]